MSLMAEIQNYQYPNEQKKISDQIAEIRNKIQQRPISDLVDDHGHQYIDLVLEGGGVLGVALVGYIYALEQAGVRFLNIAGTSVGSISALLLAAYGPSHQSKSERLIADLDSMQMSKFIDGGFLAKKLVKGLLNKQNFWTSILPTVTCLGLAGKFNKNEMGINPGTTFEAWLEDKLGKDFDTLALFNQLKNKENLLKIRNPNERDEPEKDFIRLEKEFKYNELAIVTTDTTTESKIVFPRMATLYWQNPLQVHPKKFVRASMSIPLFFKPLIIENPPKGREFFWDKLTGFKGTTPKQVYLVDGGVVSNFPIDIFHRREQIPLCPTFGVKLNVDRTQPQNIDNILHYLSALFNSARHTADYTFLHQNADYQKLIAYIDTNQSTEYDFHWLDFEMDSKKKVALFALGVKAAKAFIVGTQTTTASHPQDTGFDWCAYKELRKKIKVKLNPDEIQKRLDIKKCSIQSLLSQS